MKTTILAIIFLLIGGMIGALLGVRFGAEGALVAGSQAGACLALQTVHDMGILPSGQMDAAVRHTVGKIKTRTPLASDPNISWVDSEVDCVQTIVKMGRETQAGQ